MKISLSPLLAMAFAIAAMAGTPARAAETKTYTLPADRPGSLVVLLGVQNVRNELQLTSAQRDQLDAIRSDYHTAARSAVAKAGNSVESKKAVQQKLDALTRSYDVRAVAVLTQSQKKRLDEVERQILGGYELLSPKVQKELGLDKKQILKLAKLYTQGQKYASEVNGWFEQGEVSYNERLLYLREDRKDRAKDMLGILTPDQLKKFEAMKGEPFRI